MKHFITYLTGFCLLFCCISCNNNQKNSNANFEIPWLILKLDSTKLLVSEVVRNLDQPWEITWGPDEHLWFSEKKGYVYRMNPNTGDKEKLIETTLFGLTGEIEVKGALYNEIMPGFAALLNDKELAEILDFVLTGLNNYKDTVTEVEVSKIRKDQLK